MQFSRYIMQRTSLQMRFEDSNFNIFHPLQRNIWCNISLWKHHHLVSLDEVYFSTKIQASLRSLSSSEKCMGLSGLEPPTSRLSGVRSNRLSYKPLLLNFHQDSSFARFHQVLWGNTIISFHSMRCAIFLNSNFALLVLIKKCFGSTIISLCSMRCTFSLRFKLRFARFHQVKNAAASTYSPIPSPV